LRGGQEVPAFTSGVQHAGLDQPITRVYAVVMAA